MVHLIMIPSTYCIKYEYQVQISLSMGNNTVITNINEKLLLLENRVLYRI